MKRRAIATIPFPLARKRLKAADQRLFPRTMFGPAIVRTVRRNVDPIRVLSVGGVYQTATFLGKRRFDLVFPYYRAFDAVFRTGIRARRVLMIGGGGCAWPKHAAIAHPDIAIDVVEVDPAIIAIARELFFVGELETPPESPCAPSDPSPTAAHGTVRLVAADGRAFLESTEQRYDAILSDAFAGAHAVLSLATVEAARAVKRCLTPNGVYFANVVSRNEGRDIGFLRDEMATFSQVFSRVLVIPCPDAGFAAEDNYLLAATDGPALFDGALESDDRLFGSVLRDAR